MIASEEDGRGFCREIGGEQTIGRLVQLAQLLKQENAQQNLVSRGSLEHIWQRHFADSAQLLAHVSRETGPWLDLGSGAGFPGLVLALLRPQSRVVLVESRKRRAEWLEHASGALELQNTQVICARLEDVETFPAGQICARAFAPLGKLLDLSARFSTRDSLWLLPKGRSAAQELSEQPKQVQRMFHVEQSLTDPEAGIIVGQGVPRPL